MAEPVVVLRVDAEELIKAVEAERERCASQLDIAADTWIKEGADEKWPKRLMNLAVQIRMRP